MKILLTLFLVLSSFLFSAQNNNDSHSQDFSNETNDSSVELEVTSTIHTASDLKKTSTNINEKTKSDLKKELIIIQNQSRNLVLFCFIIFSLVVLGLWYYFKNKEKQYLIVQEELLLELESLKKKFSVQAVSTPIHDKELLTLDRLKIEKAINSKLGKSSWTILNLIFSNPSISNKELAKEVSLSLEGLSSSLRRMYQTFDIPATSNKKVTLIIKAVRLSLK